MELKEYTKEIIRVYEIYSNNKEKLTDREIEHILDLQKEAITNYGGRYNEF